MLQFKLHRFSRRIFLLMICYCFCVYKVSSSGFDADEVARVIEETFKCYNNPGLAVSVVKDGKTIFSRGFGVKNLETKGLVTADTVFQLASISKSFAATLMVKLLYKSTNLTVDSKVQELLGDKFKMMDEFRTKEATFADLMGHRMAIPANNGIRFDSNLTRESLTKRLSQLPSNDQFRVKYTYNNLMYGLVTYLAEVIGGDTWENLVTSHLLKPLGMNKTVFATTADLRNLPDLATGYVEFMNELSTVHPEHTRNYGLLAGSIAVMSTANDIAKWMNFHLKEGRDGNGRRVMAADQVKEVHKPRMLITSLTSSHELRQPQFPVTSTLNTYAHGLRRGFYRDYERLAHTGSTAGYKAMMSLVPEAQVGVFTVMTGEDTSYIHRSALQNFLLDWALGLPKSWINTTTICSFPEPWRRSPSQSSPPILNSSTTLNMSLFEGTYRNNAYGFLHVHYNTTLENLTMNYGWGNWQLFYTPRTSKDNSKYKFYCKGIGVTALNFNAIYFLRDTQDVKDKIIGIRATGFEPTLPPVFLMCKFRAIKLFMDLLLF